ncbi:hypothetical protein PsorP6_006917 [Peronosclerospora sorghi]|uniref:Uncharacterized protein n=1 Tax=Peronosclerospora sorghi TaxID=230839 RepID=A0ACC0WB83_9STRA|nr:hypothetical protein PsorP6_006917 [Peronosclerospora sorghi]
MGQGHTARNEGNGDHKACDLIDIHNPKGNRRSAGFTDEERKSFSEILDSGFVDTFRHLHPNKVEYSYFFGYRHNMRAMNKGCRLDYLVVSKALLPNVRSSFIRQSVEGGDHLPIGLELEGFS